MKKTLFAFIVINIALCKTSPAHSRENEKELIRALLRLKGMNESAPPTTTTVAPKVDSETKQHNVVDVIAEIFEAVFDLLDSSYEDPSTDENENKKDSSKRVDTSVTKAVYRSLNEKKEEQQTESQVTDSTVTEATTLSSSSVFASSSSASTSASSVSAAAYSVPSSLASAAAYSVPSSLASAAAYSGPSSSESASSSSTTSTTPHPSLPSSSASASAYSVPSSSASGAAYSVPSSTESSSPPSTTESPQRGDLLLEIVSIMFDDLRKVSKLVKDFVSEKLHP